jgi:hypothetical protein
MGHVLIATGQDLARVHVGEDPGGRRTIGHRHRSDRRDVDVGCGRRRRQDEHTDETAEKSGRILAHGFRSLT